MRKRQPPKAIAVFEPCGGISDVASNSKNDTNVPQEEGGVHLNKNCIM